MGPCFLLFGRICFWKANNSEMHTEFLVQQNQFNFLTWKIVFMIVFVNIYSFNLFFR